MTNAGPASTTIARAWRLAAPGGTFSLDETPLPSVRAGTVRVQMEASPLLTYLRDYVAGKLPYGYPSGPFTPGTNGIGVIDAVGPDVYGLKVGQRVAVNPHYVANELVSEPAQILIGLTSISPDSGGMIDDWCNGTLADYALMPASAVTPLDGLDGISSLRLATLGKFAVPFGGLVRGALLGGETLVVNGATGYFGSAAVLLAIAIGAARVVAVGRSRDKLAALRQVAGDRVATVALSGDSDADADAIKAAANGPIDMAFDQVGGAGDPSSTLAALYSLRRGGRLILMGSMAAPLPIDYGRLMANDWSIVGNFMYPRETYPRLVSLVRSGALDLDTVTIHAFDLADLPAAMDRAAEIAPLDCAVVTTQSPS